MKEKRLQNKRKPKFTKPEIKSYTTKQLSDNWNFEIFGLCPGSFSVGACCP